MEKQNLINQKQSKILEHKSYLFSTDYVVIRNQETGQTMPSDIIAKRAEARAAISLLEPEIIELEFQLQEDHALLEEQSKIGEE